MMNTTDKSIVLIQSRFSSTRLPGKALFPIEGVPLVVLTALRASNTGKEILVVTSIESDDDEICIALEKFGINYFRGSLENVLERFHDALSGQEDEKVIFRLTADNVLPDGRLLDEMETLFRSSDVDIMNCTPDLSNMPYGLSAEVTKVKWIKEAFKNSKDPYDIEHVTPYIYRNGKHVAFCSRRFAGFSNFRVTIDTYDDYISVKSLFRGVQDVTRAPIESLMMNFAGMRYRPHFSSPVKPMTLGTVQLGLNYGITNTEGKVTKRTAFEIIKKSITEGAEYIDTAAAYGESESIIGEALGGGWRSRVRLITKLRPFEKTEFSNDESWALAVRRSFYESCIKLQTRKIDVLMFHRYENTLIPAVLNEVLNIKREGLFLKLGVSVQSPDELEVILKNDEFSFIQLPFNVLDSRWSHLISEIEKARRERGLVVHARSVLLQGLLCSSDKSHWLKAKIENFQKVIEWLNYWCKKYQKKSISELCIGYANSQPWIDSIVLGIDSIPNLYSNLYSLSQPLMSDNELRAIEDSRPHVNSVSLNPALWDQYVQT